MSQVILRELKLNSAVKYVAREGFVNNFPITFDFDNQSQFQVFVGFKRAGEWDLQVLNGLPSVVLPEDLQIGQSITIHRSTPADGVPHTYQYKGNAQGGAEFSAKTIDENFGYTSRIVGEISDYNKISSDMLEQAFGDASDLVGVATEARDIAEEAKRKAEEVEGLIHDITKPDLTPYRKKDDLLFKGNVQVQATNDAGADISLQDTDGTVRGQVVATNQGLQLTQYPKDGGLQTFTFPNEGGELLVDSKLPYVTPEMFGAVGDGIADDHYALQECFNLSRTNSISILLKTKSNYMVSKPLKIYSNTILNINGAKILKGFSTSPEGSPLLNIVNDSSNIKILGGELKANFNGTNNKGNLINASGISNLHVEGTTFTDVIDVHAIDIANYKNVRILNCTFRGYKFDDPLRNMSEAIQIDPSYHLEGVKHSKNLEVRGCYFKPSDNFGSWAVGIGNHSSNREGSRVSGMDIESNHFEECTYAGIHLYGFDDVNIRGNTFNKCKESIRIMTGTGTNIKGCYNVKILSNIFRDSSSVDIMFYSVSSNFAEAPLEQYCHRDIVIDGNIMDSPGSLGILLKNSEGVSIRNNVFRNDVGVQTHVNNYIYLSNIEVYRNVFNDCGTVVWKSGFTNSSITYNTFNLSEIMRAIHCIGDSTDHVGFENMVVENNKVNNPDKRIHEFIEIASTASDNISVSFNELTGDGRISHYSRGTRGRYIDNVVPTPPIHPFASKGTIARSNFATAKTENFPNVAIGSVITYLGDTLASSFVKTTETDWTKIY